MSSKITLALFAVLLVYGSYSLVKFFYYYSKTVPLLAQEKYDIRAVSGERTLLVLGDSSAVGVGASSMDESVPALLAKRLGILSVENHAVIGARIRDIDSQLKSAEQQSYAIALVMIGGNDIVRFLSAQDAKAGMEPMLQQLSSKADRVIFISAGNIGATQLFPWPLSLYYSRLNLKYHDVFQALSDEYGVEYVNTYTDPSSDPFVLAPETYLAADGFHPSSKGYELWFQKIMQ